MHTKRQGLWRSHDFLKLWAGQTISLLGSQIGGGALRFAAILLLAATPGQLGLLTVAATLPVFLLALPAGAWADRVRRRPLLIAADLGRAALLLSIPVAYGLGMLRIELLYLVALLTGALSVLFNTAYHAFLPSVVGRDQLTEGNSKLSASDSLAEVAGPPLGGLLVQVIGAPLTVLVDALSFVASGFAIWRVRADELPPPAEDTPPIWSDIVEGLRATLGDARLRALLGVAVTNGLVSGVIGSLIDLYFLRELGMPPVLIGLVVGVGGAAALGGAFLAERLARRLGLGRTLVGSLLLSSLSTALLPLASGPAALVLLVVAQLSDVAYTVYGINEISLRQSIVPGRLLGRVGSCFLVLPTGALLVGALASGPLASAVGVRGALWAAVAVAMLAVLWLLASPLFGMRSAPSMAEADH